MLSRETFAKRVVWIVNQVCVQEHLYGVAYAQLVLLAIGAKVLHEVGAWDVFGQLEREGDDVLSSGQVFRRLVGHAASLEEDKLLGRRPWSLHPIEYGWFVLVDVIEVAWLQPELLLILESAGLGTLVDPVVPAIRIVDCDWDTTLCLLDSTFDLKQAIILAIDSQEISLWLQWVRCSAGDFCYIWRLRRVSFLYWLNVWCVGTDTLLWLKCLAD